MINMIYIAGPCVLESVDIAVSIGRELKKIGGVDFYFKASYDKANRTSMNSFRGPGFLRGIDMLREIKAELGVPVVSDVHDVSQVDEAAEVLDVIQIPAFLSRQTDLLAAAGASGRVVNIKKAQFMAPQDMEYAIEKVGSDRVWVTERGSCFGHGDIVVDFRSFDIMKDFGYPVIFDATHSVGKRRYVIPMAKAAMAYGIDGLFTEVYPEPDEALCDSAGSIRLDSVGELFA